MILNQGLCQGILFEWPIFQLFKRGVDLTNGGLFNKYSCSLFNNSQGRCRGLCCGQIKAVISIFCCGVATVNNLGLPMPVRHQQMSLVFWLLWSN